MRNRLILLALVLWAAEPVAAAAQQPTGRTVVLLHGLARSEGSMRKMGAALEAAGFETCNIGYPSTDHPIATLARAYVLPQVEACIGDGSPPVDFVTHSMGGIVVRYLAAHGLLPEVGRVVMLSPPNGGSEVVDKMGARWLFGVVNGPAGRELGTDAESLPRTLGPAPFALGILTGRRSINPILSMMIAGTDDGKVSVERAQLEGMADFLVLPATHTFIMKNAEAIGQTLAFLTTGAFVHPERP